MLKQMLGYKLQRAGGMLLLVESAYTSQICPVCGVVDAENRKTQAVFLQFARKTSAFRSGM